MPSFILQLLIISAFGLMIQSAPVNDVTKRSTDTTMSIEEKNINQIKLENNLYCAAQSLYIEGGQLHNTKYTLPPLPKIDVNSNTKRNMCRESNYDKNTKQYYYYYTT